MIKWLLMAFSLAGSFVLLNCADPTMASFDRYNRAARQAVLSGDIAGLQEALFKGADPNHEVHFQKPSCYAYPERMTCCCGYFLYRKMKVQAPLLVLAIYYQYLDIAVCLLSQKGVNIDAADSDGFSALHYAAHHNDPDAIRLLLEHGANAEVVDKRDWMPITYAIFLTRPGAVDLLACHMKIGRYSEGLDSRGRGRYSSAFHGEFSTLLI